MRRYDSYKDSGVAWIGEVPEHWDISRLALAFIENRKLNLDLAITEAYQFNYGQLVPKKREYKEEEDADTYAKYTVLQPNDIVINGLNLNYDFVSQRVAIASHEGIITSAYVCLRPRVNICSQYFCYLFKAMDSMKLFHGMGTGIRLTLSYSELKKRLIPFPPLSEQQQIVEFLNEKIANIDAYIQEKKQEISALEELKQVKIAFAVTHGINSDIQMKDSGVAWIGEVPEHWDISRLALAFIENRKLNLDLAITEAYQFNYGQLVPKKREYKEEEDADTYAKYTVLQPNDIVINGLNLNYDFVSQRVAIASHEGIITSAYVCLRPRVNICSQYFCYLFKAMDSMKLFHGMGTGIRLTLSYSELKKRLIPFPPLSEQQQIVEYIQQKTAQIDKYISDVKRQIDSLKEYRQRLICDAVTGRINVQPKL
ncbi:restriction endonuclease subunit S [Phocaeicola plebeius]|uniref:restriction endonuclease subunit S n=1 Tax=Phocaeicola plebeius TaxID=310297 RepID=UPI0035616FED